MNQPSAKLSRVSFDMQQRPNSESERYAEIPGSSPSPPDSDTCTPTGRHSPTGYQTSAPSSPEGSPRPRRKCRPSHTSRREEADAKEKMVEASGRDRGKGKMWRPRQVVSTQHTVPPWAEPNAQPPPPPSQLYANISPPASRRSVIKPASPLSSATEVDPTPIHFNRPVPGASPVMVRRSLFRSSDGPARARSVDSITRGAPWAQHTLRATPRTDSPSRAPPASDAPSWATTRMTSPSRTPPASESPQAPPASELSRAPPASEPSRATPVSEPPRASTRKASAAQQTPKTSSTPQATPGAAPPQQAAKRDGPQAAPAVTASVIPSSLSSSTTTVMSSSSFRQEMSLSERTVVSRQQVVTQACDSTVTQGIPREPSGVGGGGRCPGNAPVGSPGRGTPRSGDPSDLMYPHPHGVSETSQQQLSMKMSAKAGSEGQVLPDKLPQEQSSPTPWRKAAVKQVSAASVSTSHQQVQHKSETSADPTTLTPTHRHDQEPQQAPWRKTTPAREQQTAGPLDAPAAVSPVIQGTLKSQVTRKSNVKEKIETLTSSGAQVSSCSQAAEPQPGWRRHQHKSHPQQTSSTTSHISAAAAPSSQPPTDAAALSSKPPTDAAAPSSQPPTDAAAQQPTDKPFSSSAAAVKISTSADELSALTPATKPATLIATNATKPSIPASTPATKSVLPGSTPATKPATPAPTLATKPTSPASTEIKPGPPASAAIKPVSAAIKPATPASSAIKPATPASTATKPASTASKPATPASTVTKLATPALTATKPAAIVPSEAKPATPVPTPEAKPTTPILTPTKPITPISKPATPFPTAVSKPVTPVPTVASKPVTPVPTATSKPVTPVPTTASKPVTPVPTSISKPAASAPAFTKQPVSLLVSSDSVSVTSMTAVAGSVTQSVRGEGAADAAPGSPVRNGAAVSPGVIGSEGRVCVGTSPPLASPLLTAAHTHSPTPPLPPKQAVVVGGPPVPQAPKPAASVTTQPSSPTHPTLLTTTTSVSASASALSPPAAPAAAEATTLPAVTVVVSAGVTEESRAMPIPTPPPAPDAKLLKGGGRIPITTGGAQTPESSPVLARKDTTEASPSELPKEPVAAAMKPPETMRPPQPEFPPPPPVDQIEMAPEYGDFGSGLPPPPGFTQEIRAVMPSGFTTRLQCVSEQEGENIPSPEYVRESVTKRIKAFEKQASKEEEPLAVERPILAARPVAPWVKRTSAGPVQQERYWDMTSPESEQPEVTWTPSPPPHKEIERTKSPSRSASPREPQQAGTTPLAPPTPILTVASPRSKIASLPASVTSCKVIPPRPQLIHRQRSASTGDYYAQYVTPDDSRLVRMPVEGDTTRSSSSAGVSSTPAKDDALFDPWCDPKNPKPITFQDVSAAAFKIKSGVMNTPCTKSHMSSFTNMEIFFKKEFNQYTGSFKERGARYTLLMLPEDQQKRGVIAASAGNHALALCYHGQELQIPVTVVMPLVAPIMKVQACRQYGANVIVKGNDIGECREYALRLAKEQGLLYVNGYDHPHILAGQGTMGLEIVEQVPKIDAVVIPVGGGGLIAGVALAVKALYPHIQVIGVESERCASFSAAMKAGKPVYVKAESTLADGLAVPMVGVNAFATASRLVDKIVTVREEWIAISILRLVECEKAVVEGAGATALAAILAGELPELKGKRVVIPLCGGNIDTTVLGRCLERGLAADGRLVKFTVTVSDRPGGIAELTRLMANLGVSIKDMVHERAWIRSDIFSVERFFGSAFIDYLHFC
ncbi:uncharacterized protein [Cherax quadricarinatus]|uniref:uncharacterized protein isoform X2 n=1 Tax=Cherax quadricarinatus TaxID=27406 RepID=UPI00387EE7CD